MQSETASILKRLALTLVVATFVSHFLVVVFVFFSPTYIGGELAIRRASTFTLLLIPFVCVPTYFAFLRRDRNRKSIGIDR